MNNQKSDEKILQVKNLQTWFWTDAGIVKAVDGVSFDLHKREMLAIVGESGSGKSVTNLAIMNLIPNPPGKIIGGEVWFGGKDVLKMDKQEIRQLRGNKISMIFQDPMTSLDPTMQIGKQIMEGMIIHEGISKEEAKKRAIDLLAEVGIENPEKRFKEYPHQLSGGMRQRVVIAIALACNPDILICDEPTTALDVTIQAKILEVIKKLQVERNISVIFITHDLGVVAKVADYVDVMYAGRIIEKGSIDEIFYDPRHPYTWGLLASMPDTETNSDRLYAIPGTPPDLLKPITYDAFAPRNEYALAIDYKAEPPMFNVGGQHRVASWLCDERSPHAEMPAILKERIERMREESEKYGS